MTAEQPADPGWSIAELLVRLHVTELAGVSELADEHNDLDTWVDLSEDGIEVRCGRVGTGLAFPFDLTEFWDVVEQTEQDELDRQERTESP